MSSDVDDDMSAILFSAANMIQRVLPRTFLSIGSQGLSVSSRLGAVYQAGPATAGRPANPVSLVSYSNIRDRMIGALRQTSGQTRQFAGHELERAAAARRSGNKELAREILTMGLATLFPLKVAVGTSPAKSSMEAEPEAKPTKAVPELDKWATGSSTPPGHRDMVVQKATVLAKDYLRATGKGALSSSASRQDIAPSCGKEARRHIREALRNLQSELTTTMYLFEGSQKGHAAFCLREQDARELDKHGPDQALRIASKGILDVRLASAKLIPKAIVLPPAHFLPESPVSDGRLDDGWIQTSSRSTSLPSVGSDSVFEDHEIATASTMTIAKSASESISSHFAPGTASSHSKPDDAPSTRVSEKSLTNVDYVRKLRKIQNELFRIASKYPGAERGITARDLHSATQRTFEVVDAKTAWSGANDLLPAIRSMSKSVGFG